MEVQGHHTVEPYEEGKYNYVDLGYQPVNTTYSTNVVCYDTLTAEVHPIYITRGPLGGLAIEFNGKKQPFSYYRLSPRSDHTISQIGLLNKIVVISSKLGNIIPKLVEDITAKAAEYRKVADRWALKAEKLRNLAETNPEYFI